MNVLRSPPSLISFLSLIYSKKILYSTRYDAAGGIWITGWVDGGGEEASNAERGLRDLREGRGEVFFLLARFFAGADLAIAGGLATFSVGFLTRFGGISNIYSAGNTSETRKFL